ncbi:MAG: hypothetical protein ACOX6S_05120 [Clostridia bacterium]|jgi:hypothetical protein
MNNRERSMAILNYQSYDRLPIVHFGFWQETLEKWRDGGHLTSEEIQGVWDGSPAENAIARKLGFDFNWFTVFSPNTGLFPGFEPKVIEELPDGFRKVLNSDGVIVLQREGATSIPAEVDHLLKGRKEWEEHYLPELQYTEERIRWDILEKLKDDQERENPLGLHCGSLFGTIRNWLGLEGVSYLYMMTKTFTMRSSTR